MNVDTDMRYIYIGDEFNDYGLETELLQRCFADKLLYKVAIHGHAARRTESSTSADLPRVPALINFTATAAVP